MVESIALILPETMNKNVIEFHSNRVRFFFYRPNMMAQINRRQLSHSLFQTRSQVLFIPSAHYVKIGKIPTVSMIRNMEPLVKIASNPSSEKITNYMRCVSAKRAALNSQRVVAVSDYVKETVLYNWGVKENKVGVVHHGIDTIVKSDRPKALDENLNGNFIFTAGSIRPARGLEDLIRAIGHFARSKVSIIPDLLIAGTHTANMSGYFSKLKELVHGLNLTQNVTWLGNLNDEEMAWCYENCNLFVMTSHVEACPNIALEAMAYGCNIISTLNRPMPDFFGDAARYYSSGMHHELADLIIRAYDENADEIKRRTDLAKKKASMFTWESTAEQTLEQLGLAISKRENV